MTRHGLLNKKILAVLIALTLTAGTPFSVYATDIDGLDVNAEETVIYTEESATVDEEIAEETPVDEETVGDETVDNESAEEGNVQEIDVQEPTPEAVEEERPLVEILPEEPDTVDEQQSEETDEAPINVIYIDPEPIDTTAAEETTEADGCVKVTTYVKPQNVVSMVVPIINTDSYSFVLDPEGLLAADSSNTVIGEGSTVFFKVKDKENTYSIYADTATAVNKSSLPVKLTVDIKINNYTSENIAFTDLNEAMNSEEPSLCFAIVPTEAGMVEDGEEIVAGAPDKSEIVVTDSNGAAHKEIILPYFEDNFEIETYESDKPNFYIQKYVAKDDAKWSTVGFTLYAACSKEADWSAVAKSLFEGGRISLTLTYKMEPIVED